MLSPNPRAPKRAFSNTSVWPNRSPGRSSDDSVAAKRAYHRNNLLLGGRDAAYASVRNETLFGGLLLMATVNLICGPSGGGKSIVAMAMVLTIVAGGRLLGHTYNPMLPIYFDGMTLAPRILVYEAEKRINYYHDVCYSMLFDGSRKFDVQQQVKFIRAGSSVESSAEGPRLYLDDGSLLDDLRERLQDKSVVAVIIDTLVASCFRGQGVVNDSNAIQRIIIELQLLCEDHGVLCCVLHHVNKKATDQYNEGGRPNPAWVAGAGSLVNQLKNTVFVGPMLDTTSADRQSTEWRQVVSMKCNQVRPGLRGYLRIHGTEITDPTDTNRIMTLYSPFEDQPPARLLPKRPKGELEAPSATAVGIAIAQSGSAGASWDALKCMGLSSDTLRHALQDLEACGFVVCDAEMSLNGRPESIWRLTQQGHAEYLAHLQKRGQCAVRGRTQLVNNAAPAAAMPLPSPRSPAFLAARPGHNGQDEQLAFVQPHHRSSAAAAYAAQQWPTNGSGLGSSLPIPGTRNGTTAPSNEGIRHTTHAHVSPASVGPGAVPYANAPYRMHLLEPDPSFVPPPIVRSTSPQYDQYRSSSLAQGAQQGGHGCSGVRTSLPIPGDRGWLGGPSATTTQHAVHPQVSPAPTGQAAVRSHGAPQQQHVPEPRALPVSPPSLHHTPPHHHHYRSPALAQGGHQAGNGSSSLFTSLPIPVCRGVLAAPSTTTYQRAAHPQASPAPTGQAAARTTNGTHQPRLPDLCAPPLTTTTYQRAAPPQALPVPIGQATARATSGTYQLQPPEPCAPPPSFRHPMSPANLAAPISVAQQEPHGRSLPTPTGLVGQAAVSLSNAQQQRQRMLDPRVPSAPSAGIPNTTLVTRHHQPSGQHQAHASNNGPTISLPIHVGREGVVAPSAGASARNAHQQVPIEPAPPMPAPSLHPTGGGHLRPHQSSASACAAGMGPTRGGCGPSLLTAPATSNAPARPASHSSGPAAPSTAQQQGAHGPCLPSSTSSAGPSGMPYQGRLGTCTLDPAGALAALGDSGVGQLITLLVFVGQMSPQQIAKVFVAGKQYWDCLPTHFRPAVDEKTRVESIIAKAVWALESTGRAEASICEYLARYTAGLSLP